MITTIAITVTISNIIRTMLVMLRISGKIGSLESVRRSEIDV